MSNVPKTPNRKAKNDTRTPLTPSLSHGLNSLSISSPNKQKARKKGKTVDVYVKTKEAVDVSNPFISKAHLPLSKSTSNLPSAKSVSRSYDFRAALDLSGGSRSGSRSRPASPTRSLSGSEGFLVTEALKREAKGGIIDRMSRKEAQSQFEILKNDSVPPPRHKVTRSRSQPALGKRERVFPREHDTPHDSADRFISNRGEQDLCATLELMHLSVNSSSPGHTARLVEATGLPVNKRILAFHEAPPSASVDPLLKEQREHVKPLLHNPASGATPSAGSSTVKTRKLSTQPERVLDAPNMVDDFYLNLISWSSQNIVAVALSESTYIWRADTGSVTHLGDAPDSTFVSSVSFSADGSFLAIGNSAGAVELWDVEAGTKLRSMSGHQAQIPSLSWNGHIVSSGCGDGSIWHHDVRVARHKIAELLGHQGEVCGLTWRADGEYLASGGNDNLVNIWDSRLNDSLTSSEPDIRHSAKFSKRNHSAAVKALAWCPWQTNLLASGGGTSDAMIHIWNCNTGARLHSLGAAAQVTSLHFAPHKKEILSTHGYPDNSIMVHAYPSLTKVGEIKEAHDARVLFSCVGPAGDLVLTGAGDENLKFWRIWEVPQLTKHKKSTSLGSRDGFSAIR